MEPITIPGPKRKLDATKAETPRPFLTPDHTAEQKVYSHGRGNDPIGRDSRVKTNHPMNVCRELIPQVDAPMSLPPEDRWGLICTKNADLWAVFNYIIAGVSCESFQWARAVRKHLINRILRLQSLR